MVRDVLLQSGKAWCVFFVIVIVTFGSLVVTGHFHVDTHDDNALGVYDSALAGLPAYYNDGIATIEVLEVIALLAMPIVLLVARRYIKVLRGVSVIPWVVDVGAFFFSLFVWPGSRYEVFDQSVSSIFTRFLYMEIPLAAGLALGYGVLMWKMKRACIPTHAS